MTTAQMKSNVDTMLDEVTTGATFWTATEVYQALADGQNEIIKFLLSIYKAKFNIDPNAELPYELASVLNDDAGTTTDSYISMPAKFLWLIDAYWDNDGTVALKPCLILNRDRSFPHIEANSFLQATATDPHVYLGTVSDVLKVNFLPAVSGTGGYSLVFLKTPADIASGQEPTLPVSTHQAIVLFAVARLLFKDERKEAPGIFNQYLQIMQTFIR